MIDDCYVIVELAARLVNVDFFIHIDFVVELLCDGNQEVVEHN
jgi:hypothetical protein